MSADDVFGPALSGLDREAILRLIPHAGEMCLLDQVLTWDERFLRARSSRFAAAGNPLRRADGRLGTASAIEVAGQAMATHGRLTAGGERLSVQGMLVSLRDAECSVTIMPEVELLIEVERLIGDAAGARYRFHVSGGEETLLRGSATVRFVVPA